MTRTDMSPRDPRATDDEDFETTWAGGDPAADPLLGAPDGPPGWSATAEDPEVDALVVEIATTRSEMARTVDELGDRLAPSAVADRAGQAVREATIGKVETKVNDMTSTASDVASSAGQTAQEAGSGLVETIKSNPVPALLVGVGLGWLWMNRSQGQTSSAWRSPSDRPASWASTGRYAPSERSLWSRSGDGIGDAIGDRAQTATDAIGDKAAAARRSASETADELGATASRTANEVRYSAGQTVDQVQRTVESNPLAFGAIAVAVGTAIGLALPATQAEKRVMGQAGSRLIDQVETAVSEPLDRLSND